MNNPIYHELLKLKLISKNNLVTLSNRTRDKKIKVLKDLKSEIIFLEKYITSNHYYSSLKYKDDKKKAGRKIINIKTFHGNIKVPLIEDDRRRAIQFKKYLNYKNILDFGCGWGGFLKDIKNFKSLSGIELRNECINYIHKNIKKVKILNNIHSFKQKFDIITMFHVSINLYNDIGVYCLRISLLPDLFLNYFKLWSSKA